MNETRSRGFIQPKAGVNVNLTDNFNVFGSWAHVERFVDLSVYYNSGRVDPTVQDEKSNQFEVGAGWASEGLRAKLNGYSMSWENKAARIQDATKAGEPGYDRNGFRSELVGKSVHQGIEAEATLMLEHYLGTKGLEVNASFTYMNNKWKDVLPQVMKDPITGARRAFNTSSLNAVGKVDTLFFDELTNTPVASGPQTMMSLGLTYRTPSWFCGLNVNHFARQIALDGGTYMAVDGGFAFVNSTTRIFDPIFDRALPAYTFVNANIGTSFDLFGARATASVQVLNVFDAEYIADADRNGVYPGIGRAFRFNLFAGF